MTTLELYRGIFHSTPLSSREQERCGQALEFIQSLLPGEQAEAVRLLRQMLQEDRIRSNSRLPVKALSIRIPLTTPKLQVNFERFCPPTFSADFEQAKLRDLRQREQLSEEQYRRRVHRVKAIDQRALLELCATFVHEADHLLRGHSLSRYQDELAAYRAEQQFLQKASPLHPELCRDLLKDLHYDAQIEGVKLDLDQLRDPS